MSSFVLDSSAVLALIDEETGSEIVRTVLRDAAISTVNLAEIYTKLDKRGEDGRTAIAAVLRSVASIEPFTEEHARITGALLQQTRRFGLSLGDRLHRAGNCLRSAELYSRQNMGQIGCRLQDQSHPLNL